VSSWNEACHNSCSCNCFQYWQQTEKTTSVWYQKQKILDVIIVACNNDTVSVRDAKKSIITKSDAGYWQQKASSV
jgi:hypothetical protein